MATYGGWHLKDSNIIGEEADPKLQQRTNQFTDEILEFAYFGDGSKGPTNWKKGKHIGTGRFAKVYEVEGSHLHLNLAVKQVIRCQRYSEKEKADLLSRLDILKRLSHPRIVQFYGFCEAGGVLSLFMEQMKGGSLDEYLKDESNKPLGESSIKSILRQMLEGVSYLHSKGTFHGDIKSCNIMIDDHLQIKLADFGVYRVFQHILQWATKPLGTIRWMAPEMFYPSNDYSYEVDLWAIGCTVIEMLTRKCPFHNLKEEHQVFFKLMSTDPSPAYDLPETCPQKLMDFLTGAFQKDRSKRASANDLLLHDPFVTEDSDEPLMKRVKVSEGCVSYHGEAINRDDQVIGAIPVESNDSGFLHILQGRIHSMGKVRKVVTRRQTNN